MKLTTDDLIERLGAGAFVRFASKVDVIPSGCFVWTGHVGKNGYGQFSVARRRSALAHRVSFWLRHGRLVPSGLQIDHLCRNRACVNPDHLEAVSCFENVMRGTNVAAARAVATHCIHGHELSGWNLIVRADGRRRCRQCGIDRNRADRVRKAEEKKKGKAK